MPDFSISDMPWLTTPADPMRALSAGASVGSQMAQNRAQRQSLAQRRYEFEQSKALQLRDQALQEKLAPLQLKAVEMSNRLADLNLQKLDRELDMRKANAEISNEVANVVLQSVLSGTTVDEGVARRVGELVGRAPFKSDPELLKWLDVYNESAKIQMEQKKLQVQARFNPAVQMMELARKAGKQLPEDTQVPLNPDGTTDWTGINALISSAPLRSDLQIQRDRLEAYKTQLQQARERIERSLSETDKVRLKESLEEIDKRFYPSEGDRSEAKMKLIDSYEKRSTAPVAPVPQPSPSAALAPTPIQEVIRITKDGRRAVFNNITKEFLRYAD